MNALFAFKSGFSIFLKDKSLKILHKTKKIILYLEVRYLLVRFVQRK